MAVWLYVRYLQGMMVRTYVSLTLPAAGVEVVLYIV